jgi:hypothetical protein
MTQRAKDLRQREEAIGRFFAYGDGLEDYDERPKVFLFDYTKKMNEKMKINPLLQKEVMTFVDCYFPDGFRKSHEAKSTPKVRFEAISVGTWYAMKEDTSLSAPAIPIAEWINSDEFLYHTTSSAANTRRRVIERINYVRDCLLGKKNG